MKSRANQLPDLSIESRFDGPVCGIDEVGRGPLAGPVVTACVYIPRDAIDLPFWSGVRDSKQLSDKRRRDLSPLIRAHTVWSIAQASVEEIDRLNILQATLTAMTRAFDGVAAQTRMTQALVDGNRAPKLAVPVLTVIKGDQTSLSIAAASIIAKVERDTLMCNLDLECPGYGWAGNAGYGTAAHLEALAKLGPTKHHRRSFAPVAAAFKDERQI